MHVAATLLWDSALTPAAHDLLLRQYHDGLAKTVEEEGGTYNMSSPREPQKYTTLKNACIPARRYDQPAVRRCTNGYLKLRQYQADLSTRIQLFLFCETEGHLPEEGP